MPGKRFHSKLTPYESSIRQWRKEGKTYKECAELMMLTHRMEVHPDTINSFVIVRAKGKKMYELPEPEIIKEHPNYNLPLQKTSEKEQPQIKEKLLFKPKSIPRKKLDVRFIHDE